MKIDKTKLKTGIWYADADGNVIAHETGLMDPPANARTRHVSFPLEVREEIYLIRDCDGELVNEECRNKPMLTGCTHIGGDGKHLLQMANSGDFTLKEAIAVYANACERCMNALIWKYSNGEDGYPEYSEEWYKANTVCDYCREDEEHETAKTPV